MLEQRAFDLGTATHEGLRQLLGEFMAQPQGSFGGASCSELAWSCCGWAPRRS
jgi:hypothetical protein